MILDEPLSFAFDPISIPSKQIFQRLYDDHRRASFSVAFKQNNLYTNASIDALAVRENTASLERALREITNSVRNLLDDKMKLLTILISS